VQLGEELEARKAELMPEEEGRGNGARFRRH
jgi:hypothetical protein